MKERKNRRNLPMNCEKEGPILYSIKIQSVLTACKVERADKGSFICEQCSIYKVHRLGPFYILWLRGETVSDGNKYVTFSMPINLCYL